MSRVTVDRFCDIGIRAQTVENRSHLNSTVLENQSEPNSHLLFDKILGADFKRGDFGINANGEVTSGKPLTMRRVQAIVKKADLVGNGSFSLSVYEQKLDVIKAALGFGKLSADEFKEAARQNPLARAFLIASDILEFLKFEAD